VLGKPAWDFQFRLLPDERKSPAAYERLKSSYLDILRSGSSPWQDRSLEAVFQRTDGSQRKVEQRLFPIRTGKGFSLGGVARDITERKQAEAERENLIKELEAKNAELERFTYTVSHDLKAPLITIRGFIGFLEKDVMAGNFEHIRSDMERISNATDKMQRLLNELLELSRIGRMMNPSQAVPFEAIAREAVELVGGQINARGVKVEIAADLPTVYGDRARLVEVVQNLLDNAVKLMGDQPQPHIAIGSQGSDDSGKPIFFVRDNGLGIDPAYHDRVFGLFNKLDAHSEGTGVGLALVKRILEVHGGRIWIESEGAGKGTTFYFTLPQSNS
jgi:signal transduction histidine kinase